MINNQQIKLIQSAARGAGLRTKAGSGRYYLVLAQYKQPSGRPATSCKQLNNSQIDDFLAICESLGWRYPGKADDYFRIRRIRGENFASFAQQEAIRYLAGDMGWHNGQIGGFIKRMTGGLINNVAELSAGQAYKVIEAFKAIISREKNKRYKNLNEIQEDMEVKNEQIEPAPF